MAKGLTFEEAMSDFMQKPEEQVPQEITGEDTSSIDSEDVNDDELEVADELVEDETAASEEVSEEEEVEVEEESEEEEDDFDLESDWDDSEEVEPEVEAPEASSFDFTELGKELGVDAIKDKNSLTNYLSKMKTELTEIQEKAKRAEVLDKLPKSLQDAVQVALDGGDFLNYLGVNSVDYSKVDPVDILIDDVYASFTDANGDTDMDAANDYLDGLTEADKVYMGAKLKNQLISEQAKQSEKIKKQIQFERERRQKAVEEAVRGLDEVSGLKLSTKHKSDIQKAMSKGSIEKAILGDNYSQKDVAEMIFKVQNFDKIKNKLAQQTRSKTKKEVISNLTNSSVTKNPKKPNAKPTQRTGIDSYLNSLPGYKN